jgi:hypothetical protein
MMLLVVAAALCLFACKAKTEPAKTEPAKTEPAKTEPAKTEPAKTEPAKTEPAKTEPAKTEPAKTAAAGAANPEADCGALYDFTKQMSEAFAKKLGGAKAKGKEMPPREKFVQACMMLPPEVTRCMNPQVAMQEQARCREVMVKADKDKIMKFKTMLGGK